MPKYYLRASTLLDANFPSILHKKTIFSILHTHFYKTPTSIYLLYPIFYLNSHFSHFFYYFISNSLSLHPWDSLFQTPLWNSSLFQQTHSSLKLLSIPNSFLKFRSKHSVDLFYLNSDPSMPIQARWSKHANPSTPIQALRSKHYNPSTPIQARRS